MLLYGISNHMSLLMTGRGEFMEKIRKETYKTKIIIVFLLAFAFIGCFILRAKTVYASDLMSGYQNPEDIIITTPKDKFSTKASKISILGASDYNYPLYLNGEEIETTLYGFFTVYVDLEVGENEFVFENNGKLKTLTVTRKKSAASSSNSSGGSSTPTTTPKETYKKYETDTYGVVTANYTMPRTKISASDLSLMPITKGTTFRILGEDGNYYKIVDGTYVSKSSVKTYKKTLGNNKISKAVVTDNKKTNVLVTKLTMDINTMYSVTMNEKSIELTLYDTVTVKKPTVASNDTVRAVSVSVDKKKKTATYEFSLYDDATVCGYDVDFKDGAMFFELKKAPHLKFEGSLEGAVIYLDAGHGDTDNGALGPLSTFGPTEKDINLAITMYTKEYLEELGATVVLTRSDDTFYSLSNRVAAIRNLKPDISVSIHGNSIDLTSDYSKSSGFITYYSYNLLQDVPFIMNESISNALEFSSREPRSSSLSLTRLTTCPAVLLETKFLSNPEDYEYLIQDANQQLFAEAIGNAIKEYIEEIAVYEGETIIHIVQKGETLSAIAKSYGVSLKDILKLNRIDDVNHIISGQKIKIPR